MRLICPSCRAQYEVDDDAIPAEGRDVQCGSCSTTWFQEHALTLSGAIQAPVSESSKPVFRHQSVASSGIPAPQPMPDDSAADRDKLLREIRAEAEEEIKAAPASRIEREPLPNDSGPNPSVVRFAPVPTAADSAMPAETALDTSDVHSYGENRPENRKDAPITAAPDSSTSGEESFIQNLRSQIEEQEKQSGAFTTTRSSSVISAAERAGITIDPAKVTPPPSDSVRNENVQRTIRDLGSTPEPAPRRRSYSVGVYSAAVLFLLALAAYLLRVEIGNYYPAAAPWLAKYAGVVDSMRLLVQDLWTYASNWVMGLIGSDAPTT